MTKEELEKEAYKEAEKLKEYQTEPNNEYEKGFNNGEVRGYKDGYRDGAEPREKQIAELKRQLDLKEKALSKAKKETKRIADRVNKDKRRLIRRKAELEAQFEKMKCCYNCKHSRTDYVHCITDKHEKWEMIEK